MAPEAQRYMSADPDDLDRLHEYDAAVEDFLNDIPLGNQNQENEAPASRAISEPKDEDEEVQVKRKRRPVPKLDEDRLTSDLGLPKLRRIAKTKLKFRGKGHEFSDISRLLNTYQLWLDDLYPRAKFRDALAMAEKVGHKKSMQVKRKAWLDAIKTGGTSSNDVVEDTEANTHGTETSQMEIEPISHPEPDRIPVPPVQSKRFGQEEIPEDDELDALLAETEANVVAPKRDAQQRQRGPFMETEPDEDEDELDALLAEHNMN